MEIIQEFLRPEYGIAGLISVVFAMVIIKMRVQDMEMHKAKSLMFQEMTEKRDKEFRDLATKLIHSNDKLVKVLDGLKKKK